MNLPIFKAAIRDFILSPSPSIIVIKGKWGVGKTHAWKEVVTRCNVESTQDTYLSLYGIGTITDLKSQIIAESFINSKFFKRNVKYSLHSLVRMAQFSAIPYVKFLNIASIENVIFSSIKNRLICFDDIERRSRSLELHDFLGLIHNLYENKDCRIAIILNEDHLSLEDLNTFTTFAEKSIALRATLDPSVGESASIAAESHLSKDNRFTEAIEAAIQNGQILGINNIRIYQRAFSLLYLIADRFPELSPSVLTFAATRLILYVWSFYDQSSPSIEFLFDFKRRTTSEMGDKNAQEKGWNQILSSVGHHMYTVSDFDIELKNLVVFGGLDEEKMLAGTHHLQSEFLKAESTERYRHAWQEYHSNFNSRPEALSHNLCTAFVKEIPTRSASDLQQLVQLLRQLGETKMASDLINKFVDAHRATPEIFNIDNAASIFYISDSEIEKAFSEETRKQRTETTMGECVELVRVSGPYDSEINETLASFSEEEYFNYVRNELRADDPHIRALLDYHQVGSPDTHQLQIGSKVRSALQRIAKENSLNKARIENIWGKHVIEGS